MVISDAEDWATVGQTVRARRMKLEWSQEELARRADLGIQTIRNIEGGRQQDRKPETLTRIEQTLQLTPGVLRAIATGKPIEAVVPAEWEARLRMVEDRLDQVQNRIERVTEALRLAAADVDASDDL